MNHEQALSFLSSIYPGKDWEFRGIENKVLFFDATTPVVNEEDDYEQVYLTKNKNGWEILVDHDTKHSSPYKQPYDLAYDVDHFSNDTVGVNNSVGFDQYTYRYYGSPSQKYVSQFTNKKQHFLQVVNDGMDCNLAKGQRSTFELSKQLNFDKLVNEVHATHENLLTNYFNYIAHRICVLFDNVEESSIFDGIVASNFDDSLSDMLVVLNKIKESNSKAGYPVKLHPKFIVDVKSNITELKKEIADIHQLTNMQNKQINDVCKQLLNCMKQYK